MNIFYMHQDVTLKGLEESSHFSAIHVVTRIRGFLT
jgi:hypothetical protein